MFAALEEFSKGYQYTIAALGVLGTFLAVTVSLVVALVSQRANRTRIGARVAVSVIMHDTIAEPDYPTYVTVDVTNLGIIPVVIPMSFFFWRLPFKHGFFLVTPMDYSQEDPWVPQKRYPIEIKPRSSQSFYLSGIDVFCQEARDKFVGGTFFERLRSRFLRASVRTDDGKMCNVKLDKSIRDELRKVRNEAIEAEKIGPA
jgi:hypothetical protein